MMNVMYGGSIIEINMPIFSDTQLSVTSKYTRTFFRKVKPPA